MAKKKKKKKGIFRRIRRYIKPLIFILVILAIIGGGYIYHLSKRVETKFTRSHKWDIPSRIYSDASYYYPGMKIEVKNFRNKLNRLAYRDTGSEVKGPGDYSIEKGKIEIYLHDFNYPMQSFEGFPVRIILSDSNVIDKIIRLDSDTQVATLKLEPELISSIFGENMEDRTLITLKEAPQHLLEAIILIEDERFFRHRGVDFIAIVRAALKDLMAMKIVEGGSTLTQQLVKNYFLTSKRTLVRKAQEAVIALIIESKHTKAEILEAYINEIYLGQRGSSSVYGIGEAAKLYFSKNADQLTLPESALIAGMIKAPNAYNPFTRKKRAKARRDFVIKRLYKNGMISEEEYKEAINTPIITPKRQVKLNRAPYFIDFVKMQLADFYSDDILRKEGLKIFTTLDMSHQTIAEKTVKSELTRLEKDFANILPKDHENLLQAALISIQPQTGYIKALIGGRDYSETQFNRVSQAIRQPGSTFKPFVYLTAFAPKRADELYAPSSIIDDSSFSIMAGGENWSPKNYDKKEHGLVSLRTALTKSYNVATAKLALNVGLRNVIDTARDAGVSGELMAVPSMALGSFEVTPLEMAYSYTVFPNSGIRAEPISIINVVTKDGEILERENIKMKRVFDPGPVYLTVSVLKDVINRGTGAGSRAYGFKGIAGGKTGTTSNYRDAWFVGFTPDYLALTWVGYDDNASTNMSGARAALPIWAKFMKEVVGNSQKDFSSPNNILLVKIDPETGLLWSPRCGGEGKYEPFIEGTEPSKLCTSFKKEDILKRGKLKQE